MSAVQRSWIKHVGIDLNIDAWQFDAPVKTMEIFLKRLLISWWYRCVHMYVYITVASVHVQNFNSEQSPCGLYWHYPVTALIAVVSCVVHVPWIAIAALELTLFTQCHRYVFSVAQLRHANVVSVCVSVPNAPNQYMIAFMCNFLVCLMPSISIWLHVWFLSTPSVRHQRMAICMCDFLLNLMSRHKYMATCMCDFLVYLLSRHQRMVGYMHVNS